MILSFCSYSVVKKPCAGNSIFNEMPLVEVYVVESELEPSGIGEMGVPPTAPAVANAVFAATGNRIRQMLKLAAN